MIDIFVAHMMYLFIFMFEYVNVLTKYASFVMKRIAVDITVKIIIGGLEL